MIVITIDPSITSTAMLIGNGENEFKMFNFCKESTALNKSGLSKWFKLAEPHIEYKYINYEYNKDISYSELEILKLNSFDNVTDEILKTIKTEINETDDDIKVVIEGYSYSSADGDLIDLVTFSTLLRSKILNEVTKDITIISPKTLKLESCKMTYPPIVKTIGKRKKREVIEYKNNIGLSGGNFTKSEMFYSIIENTKINDYWFNHCLEYGDIILEPKTIKKPYDDVNDAYLIYKIVWKNFLNKEYF